MLSLKINQEFPLWQTEASQLKIYWRNSVIDLHISPFLEGKRQLPLTEVDAGYMWDELSTELNFVILIGTAPTSLVQLTKHIVIYVHF